MTATDDAALVDDLVARARAAQAAYEQGGSQRRYDRAAEAAAWAIMEPARNRRLGRERLSGVSKTIGSHIDNPHDAGTVQGQSCKSHRHGLTIKEGRNISNVPPVLREYLR